MPQKNHQKVGGGAPRKCFVTGGAGFIGSHMTDRLMSEGHSVTVYDNLSLGKKEFVQHHLSDQKFSFIQGDLLDFDKLKSSMKGCDVVFHFAANSDIIRSATNTKIDFEQGTLATYHVLESMRSNNVKKIVFACSNVVYGEAKKFPTSEDYGPLLPISMYGASKLACEGLISAFCHNFEFQAWIYRFANIIGARLTHGVILDFYRKLAKNPKELEVLGNGKQSKPYLHVSDCIEGMLFGFAHAADQVNVFNLGTEGSTAVELIASYVIEEMGLKEAKIRFTGGVRGWPGDVAAVQLDIAKMRNLGWSPKHSSNEALRLAIKVVGQELALIK